jgi:glycosyltransferase involved in cell wall biosynthesis
VIEYMSCARPIVAANLPVVRELVREDIDALLFAPDDADDLARQLGRVLDDVALAEKLATNAAERARAKLTWHAAQKKLLKVYETLAKDESRENQAFRLARRRFADTA